MGAYFDSVVVPGDVRASVKGLLTEWMARKGFELQPVPPLFHSLDDLERAAIVGSNERGTVVLLSAPDETDRFLWELRRLGRPSLRLWLLGSDVWGYSLIESDTVATTFSSNPDYYGPGKGPVGDPRGDPELVARLFSVPSGARELARLQRKRKLFAEEIVEAFCAVLGVRMAAASYAYALEDEVRGMDEMKVDRLLFAKPRSAEVSTIGGPVVIEPPRPARTPRPPLPPGYKLASAIVWVAILPLRISKGFSRMVHKLRAAPPEEQPPRRPWFRAEGDRLISDRYRCSIALPAGATASTGAPLGDALAFDVEGARIAVVSRPRSQSRGLLTLPEGSIVELDEPFAAGPFRGRRIRSLAGAAVHERAIIETPHALYAVVCGDVRSPATAAALRDAAASLRTP